MGLFDRLKRKTDASKKSDQLENFPEMLTARLLFKQKPLLNSKSILKEANRYFDNITVSDSDNAFIFAFHDIQFDLVDLKAFAQCLVAIPGEKDSGIQIPDVAFQQNWHWQEASDTANACKYELLVTDLLTRTLEYNQRLNLFINFLVAVTKATNPDVIYSVPGQKLMRPTDLINIWDKEEKQILYGICNVRLYNLTDMNELLMDTVGLNSVGLPDFQIKFKKYEVNEIATLLWNYAYYVFQQGDVIINGNTLEGTTVGSMWRCERQLSLLDPLRIVINVEPN